MRQLGDMLFRALDQHGSSLCYPFDELDDEIDIFTDDPKERREMWERSGDPTPKKSLQRCCAVIIMLRNRDWNSLLSDTGLIHRLTGYGLIAKPQDIGSPNIPMQLKCNRVEQQVDIALLELNQELAATERRIGHAAKAAFDAYVLSPWTLGAGDDLHRLFR
eukprot:3156941-Rhodomonas_salina.1